MKRGKRERKMSERRGESRGIQRGCYNDRTRWSSWNEWQIRPEVAGEMERGEGRRSYVCRRVIWRVDGGGTSGQAMGKMRRGHVLGREDQGVRLIGHDWYEGPYSVHGRVESWTAKANRDRSVEEERKRGEQTPTPSPSAAPPVMLLWAEGCNKEGKRGPPTRCYRGGMGGAAKDGGRAALQTTRVHALAGTHSQEEGTRSESRHRGAGWRRSAGQSE